MACSLRIVFWGSPDFAAKTLEYLVQQGCSIVGVVTQPDKPKGRSGTPSPCEAKAMAQKVLPGVPVLQPAKCSDPAFVAALRALEADLFVVVCYGKLLRPEVFRMPPKGCINIHPSLLPKYRGPSPMQSAVLNGDSESGVCIMNIEEAMDAGAVLACEKEPVGPNMTAGELEAILQKKGQQLLVQVLEQIEAGSQVEREQDHDQATFCGKFHPDMARITRAMSVQEAHNRIRGLTPRPGAWCEIQVKGDKRRLKIHESRINPTPKKDAFLFPCTDGFLELTQVQPEGKGKMRGADFLRGTQLEQID